MKAAVVTRFGDAPSYADFPEPAVHDRRRTLNPRRENADPR